MSTPITITLGRERLDDGSVGHTVAIGGVSMLAESEAAAQAMALELAVLVRIHTVEVTRIIDSTVNRRIAA